MYGRKLCEQCGQSSSSSSPCSVVFIRLEEGPASTKSLGLAGINGVIHLVRDDLNKNYRKKSEIIIEDAGRLQPL